MTLRPTSMDGIPAHGSSWLTSSCLVLALALFSIDGRAETPANEKPAHDKIDFFETRIRPVLIEHCYSCHNSSETAEGGLVLDFRQGLLKGGDSGPALKPGDPRSSLLLQVIRHELEGLEMPSASPRLDKSIIADFETWIRDGAVDPREHPPTQEELAKGPDWAEVLEKRKQWWSFRPITRPSVPPVTQPDWCRNDVDRFILAKLESRQLAPVGDAAPEVLIRRLFFVLTGLPPTLEELELWRTRFNSPAERDITVSQLVDDLLARPQFAEHWARHWMDWFRYADSHGSEGDPDIGEAWRYRDYLIRAFQSDVPYDQLLREQIAGDLLESPRLNETLQINESAIGPAQWRMVFHGFTPTDALDEKVRFVDDAIDVLTKGTMALTVSCARCHDHKFDAISQADYYALFGIVGSCRPGRTVIDLPEVKNTHVTALQNLKQQIRSKVASAWLSALPELTQQAWTPAPGTSITPAGSLFFPNDPTGPESGQSDLSRDWIRNRKQWEEEHQKTKEFLNHPDVQVWNMGLPQEDSHWIPTGTGPELNEPDAAAWTVALTGDQILADFFPKGVYTHTLSTRHAGRISSPDFTAKERQNLWLRICGSGRSVARPVIQHYPRAGTVFPIVTPTEDWKWQRMDLNYWNGDEVFVEISTSLDAPIPTSREERSWFGVRDVVIAPHGVDPPARKFRDAHDLFFDERIPAPASVPDLKQLWIQQMSEAIHAWQSGELSDAQADLLAAGLESRLLPNEFGTLPEVRPLVEEYRRLEQEIPVPQRVPGVSEAVARDQPLFIRGNHQTPSDPVPRRFLEAIDATPYATQQSGRLELANSLLADDNPLTRRVIVNRLWHHLFGSGLVRTPDNFGRMGEEPSHPELLDWLALRFSDHHWSMKQMIRELVLSRTWQLDSFPGSDATERDPENRLLSHASIRRLEAEAIRDSLLQISGQFDSTRYGPPVGGGSNRRSLYVAVRRTALDPFLRAFDFPEPFSSTGRRDVTNVPAQTLMLMNDERIRGLAAAGAASVLQNPKTVNDLEKIEWIVQAALSRSASVEELQFLKQYIDDSWSFQKTQHQLRQQKQETLQQLQLRDSDLLAQARIKLGTSPQKSAPPSAGLVSPVARWNFQNGLQDSIHGWTLKNVNNVMIEGGAARLNGTNYLVSTPLTVPLKEKSMEVWVELETPSQRGGGVLTVQSSSGEVFDSIVFGEMAPQEWLAGSDYARRSKSFQGTPEREAIQHPVHLVITYQKDGTITAYRDGLVYGKPYPVKSLVEFSPGETVVTIGLRHLPAGGNRYFQGRVYLAQLYDRALSADEVATSYRSSTLVETAKRIMSILTDEERLELKQNREQQTQLQADIAALPETEPQMALSVWTDVVGAVFLMKEMIYLR